MSDVVLLFSREKRKKERKRKRKRESENCTGKEVHEEEDYIGGRRKVKKLLRRLVRGLMMKVRIIDMVVLGVVFMLAAGVAVLATDGCNVCISSAEELVDAVELISSSATATGTVGLCEESVSNPLLLDRKIDVSGYGLAVDITIGCCAEEGEGNCAIKRTEPSAGFSFDSSTGGVKFTLNNINFTQEFDCESSSSEASEGDCPTVPLIGSVVTSVADPLVCFFDCVFTGISGRAVETVEEDFGVVLNLPFVLTADTPSDSDIFVSERTIYSFNKAPTGSVVALINTSPDDVAVGGNYHIIDSLFLENEAGPAINSASLAISKQNNGNFSNNVDSLRIEFSQFLDNDGGSLVALDIGDCQLTNSTMNSMGHFLRF